MVSMCWRLTVFSTDQEITMSEKLVWSGAPEDNVKMPQYLRNNVRHNYNQFLIFLLTFKTNTSFQSINTFIVKFLSFFLIIIYFLYLSCFII